MNKTQLKKPFRKNCKKISIWPFLLTGIQVPDTSTDQAHIQLSRSCIIAYADSSSNGIILNIETSLRKSSPWEVLEDQKRNRRCFFSEQVVRKNFELLRRSHSLNFFFLRLFLLRWHLRSFLTLAFLSSWVHQWFFKFEKNFQWLWWGYCENHWCNQLDRHANVKNGRKRHHESSLKNIKISSHDGAKTV